MLLLRSHCLLVGCLFATIAVANGDDVASSVDAAQTEVDVASLVAELTAKLDSSSRAERLQAEQALRDLGPKALPFLPDPEEIDSPHASEVIERLRIELEQLAATQSLEPTMVELPAFSQVGEWVQSIREQTGYAIELADESLASRNINIDEVESLTFWQAVSVIEERADVEVGRSSDGGLIIEAREEADEVWRHDARGAIRVSTSEFREIDNLIDPREFARVRTRIRIDVEPKLKGLFLHWMAGDMQAAVGEVAFTPVGADGRRELPIPASQRIEFPLDFKVPRDEWDALPDNAEPPTLSGSLLVKVATGFRTFAFRHIDEAGPIVRRRGNLAATLESFEASRDQQGKVMWEASLVVDYTGQPLELDSYQLWVFSQAVTLHREDGAVLLPDGERHASPAEGGAVRMRFLFNDPLDDLATAVLEYQAPTSIVDVQVEFALGGQEAGDGRLEDNE